MWRPSVADAHGLTGRTDLPVPGWLFAWAAALVLIASFAALAVLWPQPRLERAPERALFALPRWLDPLCGAIGVLIFAAVVYSGLAGSQVPLDNVTPTFVYALFWVGLALVSALLGDVFRPFNPWLAVARAVAWLGRGRLSRPLPYPRRLGYWPAVLGLAAFAFLELCAVDRDDPSLLAILALAYATLQWVAMALWGTEAWSRQGDAFGVYFGLFARLAPLATRGRTVIVRRPLAGATELPAGAGMVALLCVVLGATTFDGLSNSSVWVALEPGLQDGFAAVGIPATRASELAFLVGLVGAFLLVGAVFCSAVAGMARDCGRPAAELRGRFVHTLIPIALAYCLAHYFSFVIFQGQASIALASDPLGSGSDLFGTAAVSVNYGVLSASVIWYVQIAALVVGHIGGLVLAHDRALVTWSSTTEALRSQYWMLTAMVGFTSLGIWLLSAVAT